MSRPVGSQSSVHFFLMWGQVLCESEVLLIKWVDAFLYDDLRNSCRLVVSFFANHKVI